MVRKPVMYNLNRREVLLLIAIQGLCIDIHGSVPTWVPLIQKMHKTGYGTPILLLRNLWFLEFHKILWSPTVVAVHSDSLETQYDMTPLKTTFITGAHRKNVRAHTRGP